MAGCPLASPRPVNMATRILAHRRARHLLPRARRPMAGARATMPPWSLAQRGRGLHVTKCVSLIELNLMSIVDKVVDKATCPEDLPGLLKALSSAEGRQVTIRELSKLEPSEFERLCEHLGVSILTARRIKARKLEAEQLEQVSPRP